MKLIQRKNIDTKKWDDKISKSSIENVFLYSWYLDAVCKEWAALVTENYKTILPVPFTKRMSVKQFIQAPFTREYDIIGNEFSWKEAIGFLSKSFKSSHFRNSQQYVLPISQKRCHQWLDLNEDFEKNYSTNAKRILKKTKKFSIEKSNEPNIVIKLFKENVAHKVDTISKQDLVCLKKLMTSALELKKGELLLVKEENEIVAAGFFLFDKKRVTYLKGASTESAKKNGSMYFLINEAMNLYKIKFDRFDFGGSDIDKVAEFYHKFGAVDRIYFDYSINDLPFWFKALKKLKA